MYRYNSPKTLFIFPLLLLMRIIAIILTSFLLFTSCGGKKKKILAKEQVMTIQELVESFDEISLPFNFSDTLLRREEKNDSSLISKENFFRFFPDSIFKNDLGKDKGIKIYAIGKVSVKDQETYLFIKAIKPGKRVGYILCIDEKDKFRNFLPVIRDDGKKNTSFNASMDRKYNIVLSKERKEGDEVYYSNSSYYYTTAGDFMLAAINSNEKPGDEKIVNPIDTLPRKMKFSGDYIMNKKNIISVRDGRNDKERTVFISLSKNDGGCEGEVKGTLKKITENIFRFSAPGDPCSIDMTFSGRVVNIREATGCGNHRGMDCLYAGAYTMKKETKPEKKSASKKTNK